MPSLANTLAEIIIAKGSKQDAAIVRKQIADRFASRLEEVIKAAQDLHKVVGECITSCNFEVVSPAWHTFRHGLNGGYLWTDDCIRQREGLLWDVRCAEE